MRRFAFAALLALGACQPAAEAPPLTLSCASLLEFSAAALATRFGAENLVEQTVPGPEGESYTATILFPDDPVRRLEIVWANPAARDAPAAIAVSGARSDWTGPHGVVLGAPLADVQTANGRPFTLYGFGWDYGGTVGDWRDGALAPDAPCLTRVRFRATEEEAGALGDREFASDSAEMQNAAPVVSEFALVRTGE